MSNKPLIQVTINKPGPKPARRKQKARRRLHMKPSKTINVFLGQLVVPGIVLLSVLFWIWQMVKP